LGDTGGETAPASARSEFAGAEEAEGAEEAPVHASPALGAAEAAARAEALAPTITWRGSVVTIAEVLASMRPSSPAAT
jgi:hypothetical protein